MSNRIGIRAGTRDTWARGAWLATTLALGVALVAGSWANYRGAKSAVETINRGHVEVLEHALREALARAGSGEEADALEAVLVSQGEAGMRYVAFLDADGTVLMSAGEPVSPIVLPGSFIDRARALGIMVNADDRIRAFLPRVTRVRLGFGGSERGGPSGAGGGRSFPEVESGPAAPSDVGSIEREETPLEPRDPGARGLRSGDPPTGAPGERWAAPSAEFGEFRPGGLPMMGYTLIEFEPVAANQLVSQAGRSLALGSMAAALLTLAALIFWRQSVRHETTRRDLEQKRRLSQLGEMSAVLAHEIRNPLASLKGNAQVLAERLTAGSREKARADRVVGEATRLEALTGDLLEFARSGPVETRIIGPVDLLSRAIEEVGPEGFELDAREAPARWQLDEDRIRRALVNVLQNARQASPEGAISQVRVTEEEGRLIFEIRDFGAGLEAGSEDRVFDPFFTTRTAGTGLGLAVARRAAEFHGGTITARNHPEGGAVFRIILPGPGV